jgi:hypothetical protein
MTDTTLPELIDRSFQKLQQLSIQEKVLLRDIMEHYAREKAFFHVPPKKTAPIPHPIALTPFLIPVSLVPVLHQLAKAVYRFHVRVPTLYWENVLNIREICPLGKDAASWFFRYYRPAETLHNLLIRLDVGFTHDQEGQLVPVVYENNSTGLAGLFNHTFGVAILQAVVFPKIFSPEERAVIVPPPHLLQFFLTWLRQVGQQLGYSSQHLAVGFVENARAAGYSEIPQLMEYCRQQGLTVAHGDPKDLCYQDGAVVLNQIPIDLVYRDLSYAEKRFTDTGYAGLKALLQQQRVLPGFADEFYHKGLLECLSSQMYAHFFSQEEQRLFQRCIPWTRVLGERKTDVEGEQVELVAYSKAHQADLVIKPNVGASGERVMIGRAVSKKRWEQRLALALRERGKWVVQQYVKTPTRPMAYLKEGKLHFQQCYGSFGLFYYFDQLGLHCRISPAPVVNVARGGALACVFVVQ